MQKRGGPSSIAHEMREQPLHSKMQNGMLIAEIIAFGRWAILLLSAALSKLQGWVRKSMVWSISAGPMPTHIAFIMDGNRRFADRIHVDRPIGHSHGYDALLGTLKDCFDLRVKIVTLFAFSIDNFYRPSDEVSALMELMESKLEALVEKQGLASQYGIRVRVLGDLHLLPEGVRRAAENAMSVTKHNNSLVLNICVSYTATHEIVRSIQQTCNNFLSACNVSCGDVVDLLHDASYRCSNQVCNNADEANSCHVLENGSHAVQRGKGGNDELAGYNNGEVSDTESKVAADKGVRFSIPATCNGIDCACLRRRSQCNAGDSNNSAAHKTSVDVCSSSHSHVVSNGGVCRHGVSSREVENDSKAFEVTHSCIDTTYQSLISHITSTKGFHCPHRLPSCEEQTEMDFVSTRNLMNSCCLNDRIVRVAEDCISEEEIEKNLYTYPCPPPDLLIRTSGETRLSNFLLWQSSFSHLAFCEVLWPEFSFWHLFFIILEYQRGFRSLLKKRQHYSFELWRNH